MARALQLARRGRYSTMPNPHVGCVLVREGHVIGEGYTRPAGGNHAEIDKWRDETSLKRTFLKRPDLLADRSFSKDEKKILKKWCRDLERIIEA